MTDGPKLKNDTQDISLDTGLGVDPGVTGEISNGGYAFVPATIDGSPEVVDGEAFDLNPRPGSDKLNVAGNQVSGKEVTITDVTRLGSRSEAVQDEEQFPAEQMDLSPVDRPDVQGTVASGNTIDARFDRFREDDRLEREMQREQDRLEEQQELAEHPVIGRRMRGLPVHRSPMDQAAATLVYGERGATNRYETVDASDGGAE